MDGGIDDGSVPERVEGDRTGQAGKGNRVQRVAHRRSGRIRARGTYRKNQGSGGVVGLDRSSALQAGWAPASQQAAGHGRRHGDVTVPSGFDKGSGEDLIPADHGAGETGSGQRRPQLLALR